MKWFLSVFLLSFCIACAPLAKEYQGESPNFNIEEFLTGEVTGQGVFLDRAGRVKTRFRVDIKGEKEGAELALYETILYVNGDKEERVWRISRDSENALRARTGDVIGEATISNYGFAAQWRYQMALKVEGEIYHLNFDDWMYQLGDGVMLNRASVSKWGFGVGEVIISFRKIR